DIQVLASDPDYDLYGVDLGNVPPILLHPDTRAPQLTLWWKERVEYQVLDPSLEADVGRVRAQVRGDFGIASRDDGDRRWIVYDTVDSGTARYLCLDRDTGEFRALFDERPDLAGYELASMEPFSFRARDGLTVHGYVTLPPGVERRDLPAVVHVHGGPWGARHFWGFEPIGQWLANRGYACIEVDYRGSGGYGKAFLNASAREWAGRMHDDLLDGVEELVGRGWVDRGRIGIFGGSYGGYAALVGAAFTPDYFRCAVDYVGPSNLITLLESIPPYWFGVARQFDRLLGNPERDRDFLWERSPLSRVDDIRVPLLIAQGANDPRVKQAESEQIVDALRKRGVEHEYMLFEDEGHGFVRPENRRTFFLAAERFLSKHLGGRAQD
ncbi:MAG TPA: S9 family peptidase, partial [Acidimicrobiales bacterium]|nr:S9 family peptidase [Acidimicrobiales bacterium]